MSVFNFNSGKNLSAFPQIQSDLTATNLNLHCDPRTVGPTGTFLDMKSKAGKIAVEDDICDLDVSNLTVNGVLVAPRIIGPTEICDIVCPANFTMTAAADALLVGGTSIKLSADDGASSADAFISATKDISVDSKRLLTLKTGSRGINMTFLESSTSTLKITPLDTAGTGFTNIQSAGSGAAGNITPGNVGPGPGANGGAVQAVLTLTVAGIDFATGIFGPGAVAGNGLRPGDVTQVFNYYNNKIVGTSNVLITYNSRGSTITTPGVHLDVQVTAVNNGLLQLRFINLGSAPQTALATNVGFLNVLVINDA